jgi:hypothetical protein
MAILRALSACHKPGVAVARSSCRCRRRSATTAHLMLSSSNALTMSQAELTKALERHLGATRSRVCRQGIY